MTELCGGASEKRQLEMSVFTQPSIVGLLDAYFQITNTAKVINKYTNGTSLY